MGKVGPMRKVRMRAMSKKALFPGGFKVVDAQEQSIAYVYSRETPGDANIAGVLTEDEARRIASNIAKLPALLGAAGNSDWDFPERGG